MAERPVFIPSKIWPYYHEEMVSFKYYAGFALVQRQKNIQGIHGAYLKEHPDARILEASSKSVANNGYFGYFNLDLIDRSLISNKQNSDLFRPPTLG